MPSTYAHYKMGQEVLSQLGEPASKIISAHKELFDIGLHGPDILFYYKPLFPHPINRIGYDMHGRSGYEFFSKAATVIKNFETKRERFAALAYVYGFLCHFALDVSCHGYIDEKIKASEISHTEIEVEFDRLLMVEDGLDPLTQVLTNHIHPTIKNSHIISPFFPPATTDQVEKALEGMITNNKLLIAPGCFKRSFVLGLLKITGNYKEMHGLMVNREPNPMCADSNERLKALYADATKLAVRLIEDYRSWAFNPGQPDDIFSYTFGSVLPEKEGDDK